MRVKSTVSQGFSTILDDNPSEPWGSAEGGFMMIFWPMVAVHEWRKRPCCRIWANTNFGE